ncbi:hypothetical protein FF100_04360 [Methylobacterium terricola]|uniref:Uncharacterized protein n=1 Tax=Methylobacterium terricola TaxID=2583531 RepID=A0A5C4LK16_9HYPH|nr:hypothetical protein [Methylobacterium terricola]TNC14826.1 hypothetical protein FF100_04360 [Methylobacterium terricola]
MLRFPIAFVLPIAFILDLAAGPAAAQQAGSADKTVPGTPLTSLRSLRVASGINAQPVVREACGITAEIDAALNEALRARVAQAGLTVAPGRQTMQTTPTLTLVIPQPNDPAAPALLATVSIQAVKVGEEIVCAASAFTELRAALAGARVVATGQMLEQKPIGLWSHDAALLIGAAALPGRMPGFGTAIGEAFVAAWTKANPAR